jgi:hypothetical protein
MIQWGTIRGFSSAANISFNATAVSKDRHTRYCKFAPDC